MGSLFDNAGPDIRPPGFMRLSMRSSVSSIRRGRPSWALSVEMPAPMGELVDDELRWARKEVKYTQFAESDKNRRYADWVDENQDSGQHDNENGRELLRYAAQGDHEKVYESLMSNDSWFNGVSGKEVHGPFSWRQARQPTSHHHAEVLDAILQALTASNSPMSPRLTLALLSIPRVSRRNEEVWRGFNRFIRVLIGMLSCLCPWDIRPGTVCQKVSSNEHSFTDEVRSECKWGDKLRISSWPNLSDLAGMTTLAEKCEFFRSLELPTFSVRPEEQEKTQAHRVRTEELTAS
jgi:hypothetical protein